MNRRRFLGTTILGVGSALSNVPAFELDAKRLKSHDAYVRRENNRWVMGTSIVEKAINLDQGQFRLTSFKNKLSGREYIQGGVISDEIRLGVNGQEIAGDDGRWALVGEKSQRLPQGELQMDLALRHGQLEVTKHYLIYPETSIIREWLTISNSSREPVRISDPGFLENHILSSEVNELQLYYMTGGGAYNGSQLLKMDRMTLAYSRTFDSYDPSDTGRRGMSYSAYLPLLAIYNPRARDGVMLGWDYLGHWTLKAGNFRGAPVNLSLAVSGYSKDLKSEETIETPKAFTGVFTNDLDAMGNLLLDWQYRYMWELTNPHYFAKTRWAVDWPSPWVGDGGTPSGDNWGRRLALDLRYVDLMRQAGGDILWDDAGWYDNWGSWNGPDWHLTVEYLAKHGMKWVLWYPTFLATPQSEIGQKHPEWLIPRKNVFEQSIEPTAVWQQELLGKNAAAWGEFQWRYDIAPAVSATDTGYLESDQNFRGLVRNFKKAHTEGGVDACFGGGRWISYDLARLAESGEYTDGGVGPYSGYYTSLLIPPDKYHNVTDFDHTFYIPASDRVHLCLDPCWYRDPGDGSDVEAIRKDWEIYHYLTAQGVVGRWSHVFRPVVENDDPIWYFQRMNREGSKGIIIAKHAKLGPTYYVVSRPKAPKPNDVYFGGRGEMCKVVTTKAARADTGIYEDLVDHQYRYYGVPGEIYGPLNFKYANGESVVSYITSIWKLGGQQKVNDRFFGMAIQTGGRPITVTHLGQYADAKTLGTYTLMVVRGEDRGILASTDIDMSHGYVDGLGFKYAALPVPIRLNTTPAKPVVIKPRGLDAHLLYDVQTEKSGYKTSVRGHDLMEHGIELKGVEPGELIFLNLPNRPGAGSDKVPPSPPQRVTKRLGFNLGVQGVEVAWTPAHDNNWISYYEVLRDGIVCTKVAKGNFFFDYDNSARENLNARYEVRAVDGDSNRSSLALAESIAGDPETYTALGGFSPTQGKNNWKYEQSIGGDLSDLEWDCGGYEGRWVGSNPAKVGRIWMQPGASADVLRTFITPADGRLTIFGEIRKDPSAENGHSVFARILHNHQQCWPASGGAEVLPDFSKTVSYRLEDLSVAAGDRISFVLEHTDRNSPDPVIWNPTVVAIRKA